PSPVVSCLQIPNATPFSSLCKHTAPTELYTLSLHDALPICPLPARPTISVTTANCTTYTFTLNDVSGEGFTYTAQLQEDDDLDGAGGWANDGTTATANGVGTVSITGSGGSNFNTRVSNHRDFTTHRFRVLATNNLFNSTYN